MTAELPSPTAGTVKEILVTEGTNVEVGTTLLIIESSGTKPVQQKIENTPMNRNIMTIKKVDT